MIEREVKSIIYLAIELIIVGVVLYMVSYASHLRTEMAEDRNEEIITRELSCNYREFNGYSMGHTRTGIEVVNFITSYCCERKIEAYVGYKNGDDSITWRVAMLYDRVITPKNATRTLYKYNALILDGRDKAHNTGANNVLNMSTLKDEPNKLLGNLLDALPNPRQKFNTYFVYNYSSPVGWTASRLIKHNDEPPEQTNVTAIVFLER